MWPDRVSNPGPPTYESGALPIALRGPANNTIATTINDTCKTPQSIDTLHCKLCSNCNLRSWHAQVEGVLKIKMRQPS